MDIDIPVRVLFIHLTRIKLHKYESTWCCGKDLAFGFSDFGTGGERETRKVLQLMDSHIQRFP